MVQTPATALGRISLAITLFLTVTPGGRWCGYAPRCGRILEYVRKFEVGLDRSHDRLINHGEFRLQCLDELVSGWVLIHIAKRDLDGCHYARFVWVVRIGDGILTTYADGATNPNSTDDDQGRPPRFSEVSSLVISASQGINKKFRK